MERMSQRSQHAQCYTSLCYIDKHQKWFSWRPSITENIAEFLGLNLDDSTILSPHHDNVTGWVDLMPNLGCTFDGWTLHGHVLDDSSWRDLTYAVPHLKRLVAEQWGIEYTTLRTLERNALVPSDVMCALGLMLGLDLRDGRYLNPSGEYVTERVSRAVWGIGATWDLRGWTLSDYDWAMVTSLGRREGAVQTISP
jgi:hypothetical protein